MNQKNKFSTRCFTQSLICSFTHSFAHSFTHSFARSFARSLSCSITGFFKKNFSTAFSFAWFIPFFILFASLLAPIHTFPLAAPASPFAPQLDLRIALPLAHQFNPLLYLLFHSFIYQTVPHQLNNHVWSPNVRCVPPFTTPSSPSPPHHHPLHPITSPFHLVTTPCTNLLHLTLSKQVAREHDWKQAFSSI